ncbi:ferrochelatase [Niabella hirudinis]|uniref:ferrochelatase n=1 Tax=Niabella hirudinis TaxID=1285929 RepID=UPI003EB7D02F
MRKTGIILMNLGSPDSTEVKDVRRYLDEFLMDERVIDKPWLLRFLLIKGIIVPFRAPKSAEAYKTIWWKEGSPLIVLSKQLQDALQQQTELPVELSMRYGNPNPEAAYEALLKRMPDVEEVILVPLYPHYAMSSFETAVEHMKAAHKKKNYSFGIKVVPPFYKHPSYINALAESMRPYLQEHFDQLLFSYHGIPERHVLKSDPTKKHCMQVENCCFKSSPSHPTCYRHQVTITSELVAKKLGLKKDQWQQSYQSRLGRDPWLLPNTQVRLPQLPDENIKKLVVVCPSFVSDCLETLEEIEIRGKEEFLQAGGETYTYIPCMNTNGIWVDTLLQLIEETRQA